MNLVCQLHLSMPSNILLPCVNKSAILFEILKFEFSMIIYNIYVYENYYCNFKVTLSRILAWTKIFLNVYFIRALIFFKLV